MRKSARPQWAHDLTQDEWQHLKDAQHSTRPTLSQLKHDVEYQKSTKRACHECSSALRKATANA